MSQSFAPPGESASDLWFERSVFVGGLLEGVAYGIHVSIFATIVYLMIKTPPSGRVSKFFMAFILVLFAIGTIQIGTNIKFDEDMWIDDRNIPGGPIGFQTTMYNVPVETFGNSAYLVANFLADGVLLYRAFVIWNNNYYIMVIPTLAFLASTVLSVLSVFQSALPGANIWSNSTVVFAVPYFSLSIALNVVLTLLIAFRLLRMRRATIDVLGVEHAKQYTSVTSMIVESAALYSSLSLFYLICYVRNSDIQNLIIPVLDQVICIAPELIILRVAMGRAWTRQTTLRVLTTPKVNEEKISGAPMSGRTTISANNQSATLVFGSVGSVKSSSSANGSVSDIPKDTQLGEDLNTSEV